MIVTRTYCAMQNLEPASVAMLHTARCDFNDDCLTVGAAHRVRPTERFLEL